MDTKEVLLLWFTNVLVRKPSGGAITSMKNPKLANELHKPIIRKFKKEEFIHHLKTI